MLNATQASSEGVSDESGETLSLKGRTSSKRETEGGKREKVENAKFIQSCYLEQLNAFAPVHFNLLLGSLSSSSHDLLRPI